MHIVLDARKYLDFGIGTYIQNLVAEIAQREKLTLLVSPEDAPRIDAIPGVVLKISSAGKYSVKELFSIASDANALAADLFHAPHYTVPFGLRMPCVTTIHDILHIRGKKYFSPLQQGYARAVAGHACRASAAIIVDSQFTRDELLDVFQVEEKKIHVIHLGVSPLYAQHPADEEIRNFKAMRGLAHQAILYTGSLKPHKNVPTLLAAFAHLKNHADVQLVFSGESIKAHTQYWQMITALGIERRVIDIGMISRREHVLEYHAATVVVLQSHYEGFGFSVLEAMTAGTPAIGARAASIPEVMGEGGVLFNPYSSNDLSTELARVLDDPSHRSGMIERGFRNAAQFSWKKCAEETLSVYRSLQ